MGFWLSLRGLGSEGLLSQEEQEQKQVFCFKWSLTLKTKSCLLVVLLCILFVAVFCLIVVLHVFFAPPLC